MILPPTMSNRSINPLRRKMNISRRTAVVLGTFLSLILGAALPSMAQRQFVLVTGIPPLTLGAHAGADFDGDGDEDVFVTGMGPDGVLHTALYRFDRRRVVQPDPLSEPIVYADYTVVPFLKTSVWKGSVNWHDLDRNGRPDIIVSGQALLGFDGNNVAIFGPVTDIYRNDGDAQFTKMDGHGLPFVFNSKAASGDFNSDGIEDILLGGELANGSLMFGLFVGEEGFTYSAGPTTFEGLNVSSISVSDIDADGDLDFIVTGTDKNSLPETSIYLNDGQGVFVEKSTNLPDLYFAGTDFGDINFDGFDDLLLNGGFISPKFMRGDTGLYINDGAGNFTRSNNVLTGLFGGGVSLQDLDGDTDSDVFAWGLETLDTVGSEKIIVAENIDTFLLPLGSAPSILLGGIAWFDYDGNGRKDVFLSGNRSGTVTMFIYEF
ncbi:MAG: VCBS repeat-containing protein [Rhodothermales bacterium]|nr:VCBS repeat-containing protein [Rhodothermales bacterium]HAY35480.1 hypothetical protein [Bacteroidota bacterium]